MVMLLMLCGVSSVDVDVTAQWQTENNVTVDEGEIIKVIEEYFDEVNSKWDSKNSLTVYAAQIVARILDIDGVIDVTGVTFGGSTQKIETEAEEIFCFNVLNGD